MRIPASTTLTLITTYCVGELKLYLVKRKYTTNLLVTRNYTHISGKSRYTQLLPLSPQQKFIFLLSVLLLDNVRTNKVKKKNYIYILLGLFYLDIV